MKGRINYTLWICFLIVTLLLFVLASDKQFSFILTLACLFQCFGFGLVYCTILMTKDTSGLSRETFICYAQSLACRLISILRYEGYLPSDSTGDYVYRFLEILSFLFCFLTILQIKPRNEFYRWYYFAPVMLVAAYLVHPGLNAESLYDIAWTYALYLESFALLPQIHLFTKSESIELYTQNFVITQTVNKIISLVFWFYTYSELNSGFTESTISVAPWFSGYFVLGAQIVSILMTIDFVIKYFRCWQQGIPIVYLPS